MVIDDDQPQLGPGAVIPNWRIPIPLWREKPERPAVVHARDTPHLLESPGAVMPHFRIGTPVWHGKVNHPSVVQERDTDSDVDTDGSAVAKKSEMWTEATFDPREGVAARNIRAENSPVGPTESYSGSLWTRSSEGDVDADVDA